MESKALDINSVFYGVPLERLMENAGAAVAKHCKPAENIAVVAGRGNNGGDGLVAARILLREGKKVTAYVLEGKRTRLNQKNLERIPVQNLKVFEDADGLDLQGYDLVVDALVGVGLKGEVRQPLKEIIEKINQSGKKIISVDVPSAMMVKANETISLDTKKVEGAQVEDIGIPSEARLFCGPGDVEVAIPKRRPDSHKGDYGRLYVVGGSRDYIGTPTLVAKAALNVGVDLVTVCVPQYVADKMPYDENLIVKPLKSKDYITEDDIKDILKEKFDAVVFGNGVGRKSKDAVDYIMKECKTPLVLDADALSMAESQNLRPNHVITPHKGEYKRLFKRLEDPVKDVMEDARKTGATIVLKASQDTISDGTELRLNTSGNPFMTVGGTGDVLAGILAGLLAQNKDPMKSATAAAFLTGVAGDAAAHKKGISMLATDVIKAIPEAIRECQEYTQQ